MDPRLLSRALRRAVLALLPSVAHASSADAGAVAADLVSWLWVVGFALLCLMQFVFVAQQGRPPFRALARAFGLTLLLAGLATLRHEQHELRQQRRMIDWRGDHPYDWEIQNLHRQEAKTTFWWGGVIVVALSVAGAELGHMRARRRGSKRA